MANKLSEVLKIDKKIIENLGCFDPILNVDSHFFIDPKSLISTNASELKDSHKKLKTRFGQLFQLIAASKAEKDNMWMAAFRLFPKGEVAEICVGYGFDNTGGRGIGPVLIHRTIGTMKEFIESGIDDPVLFELVGLFQKDIGSDIVSDMIARTILEDIRSYTSRVSLELAKYSDIKPIKYKIDGKEYHAYWNAHNKRYVLLVPRDVLQPLPVAMDWYSVDAVSAANEKVRNDFAKMVGASDWKKASTRVNKDALKDAMVAYPIATRDVLRQYEQKDAKPTYDFTNDPMGEYSWYEDAKKYTTNNPLSLPNKQTTAEEVKVIIKKIIEQYKYLIEHKGLSASLYTRGDNKKVLHESYSQKLFYGIASAYCDANNLDISPETNSGRGPIDFKFSIGADAKILVEIKLTSNQQLVHGFTTQVGIYEKAENPHATFYLVLNVTDPKNYTNDLATEIANATRDKKPMPEVIYVDAQIKESASKAKE